MPSEREGKPRAEGYIPVYLSDDHPFAEMRNGGGYVLKHRLVMAKRVGRPLTPFEKVHHRDEDKSNNADGNLILTNAGQHRRYHGTQHSPETRAKIAETQRRRWQIRNSRTLS